MMNKQFDGKMNLGFGTEGLPQQGAQGAHVHGARGVHVQGADGEHIYGARAKWQDDFGANRRLTLPQKQVLEQLAIWLKGTEGRIYRIYWKLGRVLGMSQRATRVHIGALRKKGVISSTVVYSSKSRQRIGLHVSFSRDAPIKHLPHTHKFSENELLEMKERKRKSDQFAALIRQGYSFIPELQCYVLPPPHLDR